MARNEADREDLMAEAVSLVQRIEFEYPGNPKPALVGINQLHWLFVYRDQDTMYRFDDQGRLRRAFIGGTLFRTTGQTLAAMVRDRHESPGGSDEPAESALLRRDLTLEELDAFHDQMKQILTELSQGLNTGTILRQHPADAQDLAHALRQRLEQVLQSRELLAPPIVRR